jgi:hypothetical protein
MRHRRVGESVMDMVTLLLLMREELWSEPVAD